MRGLGPHWPRARPHSTEVKHLALLRVEDASFLWSSRLCGPPTEPAGPCPEINTSTRGPGPGAARRASDQPSLGSVSTPRFQLGTAPDPRLSLGLALGLCSGWSRYPWDTAPAGNWSCSARAAISARKTRASWGAASCPD